MSRLTELTAADWRLLLAAVLWLPVVRLGLRSLGLRRVRRLLGLSAGREGATPPRELAERTDRLVRAAARRHPLSFTCLARALVVQRLLAARGWKSELRIGVRSLGGTLEAHAWVECAGTPLGEGPEVGDRFAPLRSGAAPP